MQYNKEYDYWVDKDPELEYYEPIESTYFKSAKEALESVIDELYNGSNINEKKMCRSLKHLCWHLDISNEYKNVLNYEMSLPLNCLRK